MRSPHSTEVDELGWASAIKADTPVLVKFTAEWCGPCKAVAPALAEIAAEERAEAGRFTIAELDVDHSPAVAERYHVRGVPTMILFEGGEELARVVGGRSKA